MHTSTTFGGGEHLAQGHAGCEGGMPQPVPMVQCGGVGTEKGWITMLLCRLPQAKHTYHEELISLAANSESAGDYGRCHTLLHDGF